VLDRAFVQRTRDAFADTSAADDLDWLAAVSVRSTECEGDVVCIVGNQNTLGGDYLGRWPSGRHVDEALRETARQLNGQMDNLEKFPRVLAAFRPESDCGALHASLDPLRTVVAASTSGSKALALTAIDRFARLCLAPSH
jgi:hypothetical protein